jgi:hypothetical protein
MNAVQLLFTAYRLGKEEETQDVYASMLADIPPKLLNKTIKKCICEQKFLPAIAEIRQAAMSLMGTVDPSRKVKTWQEAQTEISKGLSRTWFVGCLGEVPADYPDFGQPCEPKWSTPEIKAAVDSYGLDSLNRVMEDDMPTVWAQLRRAYDQACQRKDEAAVNSYVLGKDAGRMQQLVGSIGLLPEEKEVKEDAE